jgi:hypothetical protein
LEVTENVETHRTDTARIGRACDDECWSDGRKPGEHLVITWDWGGPPNLEGIGKAVRELSRGRVDLRVVPDTCDAGYAVVVANYVLTDDEAEGAFFEYEEEVFAREQPYPYRRGTLAEVGPGLFLYEPRAMVESKADAGAAMPEGRRGPGYFIVHVDGRLGWAVYEAVGLHACHFGPVSGKDKDRNVYVLAPLHRELPLVTCATEDEAFNWVDQKEGLVVAPIVITAEGVKTKGDGR